VITQTKSQADFIRMVANHLAKNFIASLLELTKEESYSARIGGWQKLLTGQMNFVTSIMTRLQTGKCFAGVAIISIMPLLLMI
jgi:hypothetical protein